jgi:hypothetical protein
MSPFYKGHMSSNEGTERDMNQQKHNHTQGNFLKGLEEEEEEPWKYNPSREWDKCESRKNTTIMKTTNEKMKECINKCQTRIIKFMKDVCSQR